MPLMSAEAFTLILFSALMHALWNLLVKRSRDKRRTDLVEEGIGDARIRQVADVYRAPPKREVLH